MQIYGPLCVRDARDDKKKTKTKKSSRQQLRSPGLCLCRVRDSFHEHAFHACCFVCAVPRYVDRRLWPILSHSLAHDHTIITAVLPALQLTITGNGHGLAPTGICCRAASSAKAQQNNSGHGWPNLLIWEKAKVAPRPVGNGSGM